MNCPKCKEGILTLADYDSVYIVDSIEKVKEGGTLLDDLFHCKLQCWSCGFSEWTGATIVYPQLEIKSEGNVFERLSNIAIDDQAEKDKADLANANTLTIFEEILNDIVITIIHKIDKADIKGCKIDLSTETNTCKQRGYIQRWIKLQKPGTGDNSHINLYDNMPIQIKSNTISKDKYSILSKDYHFTFESKKTKGEKIKIEEIDSLEKLIADSIEHFILNVK